MKKQAQIDELKEQVERMQERIDQLEGRTYTPIWLWWPQPYPVPYPSPYVPTTPPIITVTGTSTWEVTPDSYTMIYDDLSMVSGMYLNE